MVSVGRLALDMCIDSSLDFSGACTAFPPAGRMEGLFRATRVYRACWVCEVTRNVHRRRRDGPASAEVWRLIVAGSRAFVSFDASSSSLEDPARGSSAVAYSVLGVEKEREREREECVCGVSVREQGGGWTPSRW